MYRQHEDHGTYGLIPEDAPNTFEPLTGMGVVHDIIEHSPGQEGGLHDEMCAFGVAHWVRGQGEYWRRSNPQAFNTSASQNTHAENRDVLR